MEFSVGQVVGQGVPEGGLLNQVLVKNGPSNFEYAWASLGETDAITNLQARLETIANNLMTPDGTYVHGTSLYLGEKAYVSDNSLVLGVRNV